MSSYRVGVLGCASIAKRMVIPAVEECESTSLVKIASRAEDKAKTWSAQYGCGHAKSYDDLLADPDIDIVYIPLPTGMHYEWIMKSLEAGKHVLAEKSIAQERKFVEEIVGYADKKNLAVFENFMFKHHPQFDFVKQQVAEGAIGRLTLLRSSFGFPPFKEDNIRYRQELGGGALLDAGAYTCMATQMFLGKGIQVVGSTLCIDSRYDVDTLGAAQLQNSHNQIAQLAFSFDNYYQCSIELWGTKGKLTMERSFTAGPGIRPRVVIETQDERKEYTLPAANHCRLLLSAMTDSLDKGDWSKETETILQQARLIDDIKRQACNKS